MKLEDKNLEQFLCTILNKKIDDITKTDIEQFERIVFNGKRYDNTDNKVNYDIVNDMPNLKDVCISNEKFDAAKANVLNSIIRLDLDSCEIITKDIFKDNKLEELSMFRCNVDSYDNLIENLHSLSKLEIVNPSDENEIDLSKISPKIITLDLRECIINNIQCLESFDSCENLCLFRTYIDISKSDIFLKMKSLKKLIVSKEYISDEVINELTNKGIKVKFDLFDDEYVDDLDEGLNK